MFDEHVFFFSSLFSKLSDVGMKPICVVERHASQSTITEHLSLFWSLQKPKHLYESEQGVMTSSAFSQQQWL